VKIWVEYSEEDEQFVGLCDMFPGSSWLADTKKDALIGILEFVVEQLEDEPELIEQLEGADI
jgi:predicted RNase H-like HicB family nuclease